MAFNPVSFFAGIGTVAAAIAVGFGGGLFMTNTVHKSEAPNRLERVASSAPLATPAAPQAPASPIQASIAPDATPAPAPAAEPRSSASPQQVTPPQPPQPPPVQTTQAANQQPAVATDPPPPLARESAKPQDQDNDARKIADRRHTERRKWAERKRRQQELEGATVETRKIDRDDGSREVVRRDDGSREVVRRDDSGREVVRRDIVDQRDIIETPRSGLLGFFGQ
jgi:hypothetical protein